MSAPLQIIIRNNDNNNTKYLTQHIQEKAHKLDQQVEDNLSLIVSQSENHPVMALRVCVRERRSPQLKRPIVEALEKRDESRGR